MGVLYTSFVYFTFSDTRCMHVFCKIVENEKLPNFFIKWEKEEGGEQEGEKVFFSS